MKKIINIILLILLLLSVFNSVTLASSVRPQDIRPNNSSTTDDTEHIQIRQSVNPQNIRPDDSGPTHSQVLSRLIGTILNIISIILIPICFVISVLYIYKSKSKPTKKWILGTIILLSPIVLLLISLILQH